MEWGERHTKRTILCLRKGWGHSALQDHIPDLSAKVKCVRKPIWENSHMHMKNLDQKAAGIRTR